MTVSDKAMAADQARAATSGLLSALLGTPAVNGKGVGVAVVDSGIAYSRGAVGQSHGLDELRDRRTGRTTTRSVMARTSPASSPAPRRVRARRRSTRTASRPARISSTSACSTAKGSGYTSDVIAGIQWVVANRSKYGDPRDEPVARPSGGQQPCAFDPLCLAAESAVAAGWSWWRRPATRGKDAEGRTVLGSISTPGNAPGRDHRWRAQHLEHGVARRRHRHHLQLARSDALRHDAEARRGRARQQDRVARGGGFVPGRPPIRRTHVAGSGTNAYSRMSGTSMAAAMVSGGAALCSSRRPPDAATRESRAADHARRSCPKPGMVAAGTGSVNLYSRPQRSRPATTDCLASCRPC